MSTVFLALRSDVLTDIRYGINVYYFIVGWRQANSSSPLPPLRSSSWLSSWSLCLISWSLVLFGRKQRSQDGGDRKDGRPQDGRCWIMADYGCGWKAKTTHPTPLSTHLQVKWLPFVWQEFSLSAKDKFEVTEKATIVLIEGFNAIVNYSNRRRIEWIFCHGNSI